MFRTPRQLHWSRRARKRRRLPRYERLERRDLLAAIWDGGGDAVSWHDADNWEGDELPTATDDVQIPALADTARVVFSSGTVAVNSLSSAEELRIAGGTLTLTNTSNIDGVLTLAAGHFAGGGTLTVAQFDWRDGRIEHADVVVTGELNLNSEIDPRLESGARLTLASTATGVWTGGQLRLSGTLEIAGSMDIQTDASVLNGGSIHILPGGLVTKSSGTGTQRISPSFTNDGELRIDIGAMRFDQGNTVGQQDDGIYRIADGSTLQFNGGDELSGRPRTISATATMIGAGGLTFSANPSGRRSTYINAGTYDVTGPVTMSAGVTHFNIEAAIPDVTLTFDSEAGASHTLGGTGNLTVNDLHWIDGRVDTSMTVVGSFALDSDNDPRLLDQGSLTLAEGATGVWTGSLWRVSGTLEIAGSLDIQTDASVLNGGSIHILPGGLVTKSSGTGTQRISPSFTNDGELRIDIGAMRFDQGNTVGQQDDGIYRVAAGSTLQFNGGDELSGRPRTISASATMTGAGGLTFSANPSGRRSTYIDAGTYDVTGPVTMSAGVTHFNIEATIPDLTLTFDSGAGTSHTLGGTGNLTVNDLHWINGRVDTSMTVVDSFALDSDNDPRLLDQGSLTLAEGATGVWTGSQWRLSGPFTVAGEFVSQTNSRITGAGTIAIQPTGSFHKTSGGAQQIDTLVTQSGELFVQAGQSLDFRRSVTQTGGTTTLVGDANFSTPFQLQGGTLSGIGTIMGDVNNSGGVISPGLLRGTLTVAGNYTQSAAGALAIELESGSVYDRLDVSGTATLDGTLAVATVDNFAPNVASEFTFLTFGALNGDFANETGLNLAGERSLARETEAIQMTLIVEQSNRQPSVHAPDIELVADLNEGAALLNPRSFVGLGGKTYFIGDSALGDELFVYDPSADEIGLVADIRKGPSSAFSSTSELTSFAGKLYFFAVGGNTQDSVRAGLWQFDPGTNAVDLIQPSSILHGFTELDGKLYFFAGTQLQVMDADGAITDLAASVESNSNKLLVALAGKLYYFPNDQELWQFDLASGGSTKVADLGNVRFAIPLEGKLYVGGNGDVIVFDPDSGIANSIPLEAGTLQRVAAALDGQLYFTVRIGFFDRLWRIDPQADAAAIVSGAADLNLRQAREIVGLAGNLYFTAGELFPEDWELWTYSPVEDAVSLVADLNSTTASRPDALAAVDGRLYFSAFGDSGKPLWFYDPASAGPPEPRNLTENRSSHPNRLINVADKLYFNATTAAFDEPIFVLDATSGQVSVAVDLEASFGSSARVHSILPFVELGGQLYFGIGPIDGGIARYNPADGSTVLVVDTQAEGIPDLLFEMVAIDDKIYFQGQSDAAGQELWRYDSSDGSVVLIDIEPGSSSSSPANLTVVSSKLFFIARRSDTGDAAWMLDPTDDSISLVADIRADKFTELAAEVYFTARDEEGNKLWRFDPADASLRSVFRGSVSELTAFGDQLYYGRSDGGALDELYAYDPVADIVTLAAEINLGEGSARLLSLTAANGRLFFEAQDGESGQRAWSFDPLTGSFSRIGDLDGPELYRFLHPQVIDATMYYRAIDTQVGSELFSIDASQTFLTAEIADRVVTIRGRVTDADAGDTHNVVIDWGDESISNATVDQDSGEFVAMHEFDLSALATQPFQTLRMYVTATDNAGASDTAEIRLTVLAVTADAGGPYLAEEGASITFDATLSGPDTSQQPLTYEWDLDYDGASFDVDHTGVQPIVNFTDDIADHTVALRVTSPAGVVDLATTTLTILNVPPALTEADGQSSVVLSVDADDLATLAGSFLDPGLDDTHTIHVNWDDGTTTDINFTLGERSFITQHQYARNTSAVPLVHTVTIVVTDDDGGRDTRSLDITILPDLAAISGTKFHDVNGNGSRDPDEEGLANWRIQLIDQVTGEVVATTATDVNGDYEFNVVAGDYVIREVLQTGWHQTFPYGTTQRVSVDAAGGEGNEHSGAPAVSDNGRFVAFASLADNLVSDDSNQHSDIFVMDRETGAIERVSLTATGDEADGPSFDPAISSDGNIVTFRSLATNLVPDDRNAVSDIFLYDRRNGVVRRASLNVGGDEGNGNSLAPSISGDGRFLAFESTASNLVPADTNGTSDVFVFDAWLGLIERVSVDSDAKEADRPSHQAAISRDGRFVTFTSYAGLHGKDVNDALDVYLYDRSADTIDWVSRSASPGLGDGPSFDPNPSISGAGRFVAFTSVASNLNAADRNGHADVFVYDAMNRRLSQITRGNQPSFNASLSGDGRYIALASRASDLVPDDTNSSADVFLYDRELDVFSRITRAADGGSADTLWVDPVLSGDASTVVFASDATNHVADDSNQAIDIFATETIGVHRLTVTSDSVVAGLDFGNQFRLATISGQKFNDLNANGIRDVDPETNEFTEPGLDGWTVRLVNRATGEVVETETQSTDLDDDGSIDPINESGWYTFGPLQPGEYDIFEILQDPWQPTLPGVPGPALRFPDGTAGSLAQTASNIGFIDPRLIDFVTPSDLIGAGDNNPIVAPTASFIVPAVSPDTPEQLPIVYVHGFVDDGSGWGNTGRYFENLADVTGGKSFELGSAEITTYGIQFWAGSDGDPFANSSEGEAFLKTLAQLRLPPAGPTLATNPHNRPTPLAVITESLVEVVQLADDCFKLDLNSNAGACIELPKEIAKFLDALKDQPSDYNQNGLAKYHATDLRDLLAETLGSAELNGYSQVNILTHSAGGLDTRALLDKLDGNANRVLREGVANVIYTAPPFGGSTLAELQVALYEDIVSPETFLNPWFLAMPKEVNLPVLFKAIFGDQITRTLYQAFDPIAQATGTINEYLESSPSLEHIREQVDFLIDAIFKVATVVQGASADVLNAPLNEIHQRLENKPDLGFSPAIELIKLMVSSFMGYPGNPKASQDLRPYEAVHNNLLAFDANLTVPQFVIWGEAGFLRKGVNVNLGPSLEELTEESLHAYGNASRDGNDFNDLSMVGGDGAVSRSSALALTDLVGEYMIALAGFSSHDHGSIISDLLQLETDIQGSFLDNDTGTKASVAEVLVETFLTPVTEIKLEGVIPGRDDAAREYLVAESTTVAFRPRQREFRDQYGNVFSVDSQEVEFRVVKSQGDGAELAPADWQSAIPFTPISFASIAAQYEIADEQAFRLEWRSINQQGAREAIRSAIFRVDGTAPTLVGSVVVESNGTKDQSQIKRSSRPSPVQLTSDHLLTQLNPADISRLRLQPTSEWYVNLDRPKHMRLFFDDEVALEYRWDDPELENPRSISNAGFQQEFTLQVRENNGLQFGVGGIDFLDEGFHTLYFRATDASGNTSAIESVTLFVDHTAPLISFNTKPEQIVGPATPLSFFAHDVDSGLRTASIEVPDVGMVKNGAAFSLGETNLNRSVASGEVVALTATAIDHVSNAATAIMRVRYDYEGPILAVQDVSHATQLPDGGFIVTLPSADFTVTASDLVAGIDANTVGWTLSNANTGAFLRGQFSRVAGESYVGTIDIPIGRNLLYLAASDSVGNRSRRQFTIYRADGHHVTVERGDMLDDLHFGNMRSAEISGSVFNDANGNGKFDVSDEGGLEKVRVFLDADADGERDAEEPQVITGIDGSYQFQGLLPSPYRVRQLPLAGWEIVEPESSFYDVTVESGDVLVNRDFANVFLGPTLAGVVFADSNGDGALESGDSGVAGRNVILEDTDGKQVSKQFSDVSGRFAFTNLALGDYRVRLQTQTGHTSTTPTTFDVALSEVTIIDDLAFGDFELVNLSGRVFLDVNMSGKLDAAEAGLAGWTISLDENNNGTIDRTATSDASGEYVFAGVGPGRSRVHLESRSGWTQTVPRDASDYTVQASSGQDVGALDLGVFTSLGVLAGKKFHDFDGDGKQQSNEPGIDAWALFAVDLQSGKIVARTETFSADLDGNNSIDPATESGLYELLVPAGQYEIREIPQASWEQTFPEPSGSGGVHQVEIKSREIMAGLDFGNRRLNFPPTLDPIDDLAIDEDAVATQITLTGISPGSGDAGQPVTITAVSDNPAVIADPVVAYSDPATMATLSFSPVANASGTVEITVTASDGRDATTRTFQVTVAPINDRPVFSDADGFRLASIQPNDFDNNGTSVRELLNSIAPLEAITDVDGPARGIAITDVDESNGIWQFSVDGGATWNNVGPFSNNPATPAEARALLAEDPTRVRFVPDAGFVGDANFAFAAWDTLFGTNGEKSFLTLFATSISTTAKVATIEVLVSNFDSDGVDDRTEDAGPNGGDGNGDGILDSQQGHVASLPAANGQYITLAASPGSDLSDVVVSPNPSQQPLPRGVSAPLGFIKFRLPANEGVAVVNIFLAPDSHVNSYFKYGPTPDEPEPHFYRFDFDEATQTGAKIFSDRIELHFVDGERGDEDLQRNGVIVDPGAPTFDAAELVALDEKHGFYFAQDYYENWGGRGEKWLKDRRGAWHFVLPNGELYEWLGAKTATGTLIGTLSSDVHATPALLHDAADRFDLDLEAIDAQQGFYFSASYHQNWGNRGEKWLKDGAGDWYFLLPNGELSKWDRSEKATGEFVLLLNHDVHGNPALLHDASAGPVAEAEGHPTSPVLVTNNAFLVAPGLPPFPEKISAWTNPFNRFDVNSDEHVSPLDVLLIVNELIAGAFITAGPLPTRDHSAVYLDVSNDGSLSPVDALQIINRLSDDFAEGEFSVILAQRQASKDVESPATARIASRNDAAIVDWDASVVHVLAATRAEWNRQRRLRPNAQLQDLALDEYLRTDSLSSDRL